MPGLSVTKYPFYDKLMYRPGTSHFLVFLAQGKLGGASCGEIQYKSLIMESTRQTLQTIGEFELLEMIAEGGMGAVYKARQTGTALPVAIKILPAHLAKNPVLLKRFEQEYNAASSLNHPNIVRALAFGYQGESPYLVMEYVEGESLGDRLEREGLIEEREAIQIIMQVAQGLQKAHREGLVHRDVKPDNVLVTRDGIAKLADLGLVKEMETDLNLTRTGRGLGTPHFMAPEQFRNAKNVDSRSDVYSLAATLYMMVTGELPFKSLGPLEAWTKKVENKLKPAREIVPTLSERVDWAIRRAMMADPAQRPSSCREFIEDLTGQSTRPLSEDVITTGMEIWYLRLKDDNGVLHTVKESLVSIRSSLKKGQLGDISNIRASRNQTGPFEPLKKHPEFRDLVIAAAMAGTQKDSVITPASAHRFKVGPGSAAVIRSNPPQFPGSTVAPPRSALQIKTEQEPPGSALNRKVLAPAPDPAPTELPVGPHIDIADSSGPVELSKTLFFMMLALLAGLTGFFLLPQLFK